MSFSNVVVGPALVAWTGGLDDADLARTYASLDGTELARATQLGSQQRRRFLTGRTLLRNLASELFPEAGQAFGVASVACPRCGRAHAGVELRGLPARASLAYADDELAVAAIASSGRVANLGVDAEREAMDEVRTRDLESRIGRSSEPASRRWTRIEALLKADGRGLHVDPARVRLSSGSGWIAGEPLRYQLAPVPGPDGYAISLAWLPSEDQATRDGRATR